MIQAYRYLLHQVHALCRYLAATLFTTWPADTKESDYYGNPCPPGLLIFPNAIFLNQPWNRGFTCPAKLLDQERSQGRDRGERREDGAAIEPALQVHLPYQAGAGVWIIR